MIPDGSQYAEQFVSLNSHFRRRLMRTKNLWICQTVSRWLLGSITISSSSNLRQLQHWKLWMCQPFGRPRLQYLNHLREARHLWQIFDRHLSPDEILYLKWHLWLQSTWMEYERFQDIGNHQKTRWESKLNQSWTPLHLVDLLAIWWVLSQTCPSSMAMSQSIESRAMSESFRMPTAAVQYTDYIKII